MRAFGAIAVNVTAFIIGFGHGHVEQPLGLLDLGADLWQIGDLQRCTILLDDIHEWDIIEIQLIISYIEAFLGEIEGLMYKVGIAIIHGLTKVSELLVNY